MITTLSIGALFGSVNQLRDLHISWDHITELQITSCIYGMYCKLNALGRFDLRPDCFYNMVKNRYYLLHCFFKIDNHAESLLTKRNWSLNSPAITLDLP